MEDREEQKGAIFEQTTSLVKRRRWCIIPLACAIALTTIVASYRLPNRYDSEATILVVQQRVPERYVTPTSSTDLRSLDAMTEDVLSRTQLLTMIDELGLYPKERKRLAPEQLVDLIKQHLSLKPVQSDVQRRDIDALKISFQADSPRLAQEVTSRLTTLFIQQNLKTRADMANTTTKFLHGQLETARTKLADQEQRLKDYKMQYLGELPEQQQGNLGILTSLQSQLQNVSSSLSRAMQQKLYLESLLAQYQHISQGAPGLTISGNLPVQQTVSPIHVAEGDLTLLQSEKEQLLTSYTPKHPEVLRKNQQIAQKQAQIDRLKSAATTTTEEPGPAMVPAAIAHQASKESKQDDNATVAQLKSQLEANRLEVENLLTSEQKLQRSVSQYEARLNLTPVREQQLTSLLRDYDLMKQHYADLLGKEQQSQLATTLEKEQEGQQFRLVDPPSLPTIPSSPKRVRISMIGAVAGILMGLALAFVIDLRNPSFHSEQSVSQRIRFHFVIGIPLLVSRRERRICRFKRAFEWLGGIVLVLAVFVAEFYVYRHG